MILRILTMLSFQSWVFSSDTTFALLSCWFSHSQLGGFFSRILPLKFCYLNLLYHDWSRYDDTTTRLGLRSGSSNHSISPYKRGTTFTIFDRGSDHYCCGPWQTYVIRGNGKHKGKLGQRNKHTTEGEQATRREGHRVGKSVKPFRILEINKWWQTWTAHRLKSHVSKC
jgi:hypothetical protein